MSGCTPSYQITDKMLLSTAPGAYVIQCEIVCNEYAQAVTQEITVVVEG